MTMPGSGYDYTICYACGHRHKFSEPCITNKPQENEAPIRQCPCVLLDRKDFISNEAYQKYLRDRAVNEAPKIRSRLLPEDAAERKKYPMCAGLVDYFPDALAAVAHVSWKGNEQHNPGEPVHWARGKSTDQADTLMRHLVQRGTLDVDGMRHSAKMAWRALALLQEELEKEMGLEMPRGCR